MFITEECWKQSLSAKAHVHARFDDAKGMGFRAFGVVESSVNESTHWMLTMSKSITSREIDGPPSFLAVQAADGLLSHIALLVSFQYSFPHNARE
jgi:hypothetical protein